MICQMSGHRDPSRMCTKDMPQEEVAFMVNYLSDSRLLEDWRFGKEPYSRANPPPVVSRLFSLSLDCLLLAEFCFDQSALVRIPFFIHQPAPRGRPVSSSPLGRIATSTTPIWGRRLRRTTPREEEEQQVTSGLRLLSPTGLTTTPRGKSPPAIGKEPASLARALLPRRVLQAAGRSAGPCRPCSAVGRRNPRVRLRRPGGTRRPRRLSASVRK